ncbi:hypothetical protein H0H92_011373 [Tricholoma furcatifolium]|nr:hypothetical protein H0H92_011373 [Tricholoma furcatifolium]
MSSFGGTPLQDNRRLPHNVFFKPPSQGNKDPKPLPTTAAIYGQQQRLSPPRRDLDDETITLRRIQQLKQQQAVSHPGGPKTTTSPLKPDRWDVPDTTVQIAGAFNSAVNSALASMNNPNQSWASNASQPSLNSLRRSTSVEYEAAAANAKRLQISSRPGPSSRSHVPRKPLSKSASYTNGVPDSEGEEQEPARKERGKSPFMDIVERASRAVDTATYFARRRLTEPGEPSQERQERETSYGYEEEEREFQNRASSDRRSVVANQKRNRLSVDNRAYKPTLSDEESDDEDNDSDGKTRKRKKKKREPAGAMNNLPVISADKRKKRKSKSKKDTSGELDGDEGTGSDEESIDQPSRTSLRPSDRPRHPSLPRELSSLDHNAADISVDMEQGLDSIPEADEDDLVDTSEDIPPRPQAPLRRSVSRPPTVGIGGRLGQVVHYLVRNIFSIVILVWRLFNGLLYLFGQLVGHAYDVLLRRPLSWLSPARGGAGTIFRMMLLGLLLSALYTLREPLLRSIPVPDFGSKPVYQAPEIPAANIAELAARFQVLETALAGLSVEMEKGRLRADSEGKIQSELAGRLGMVESRVRVESKKAAEAEAERDVSKEAFSIVRRELEVLQAQLKAVQQQQQQQPRIPPPRHGDGAANDEEARARVLALEERVGSVEGGLKEAIELGKKAGVDAGDAWWNKLASGTAARSGLTIKSSDGQDVTSLIGHLVDTAVSTFSKDGIARPDYALHSGGARVIPSLTSPTYEMKPSTLTGSILGFITGNGYAVGRPPVTALHHELHNGHCWPVAGHIGQLGVALAAPIRIDAVTIDHVAADVAFDMRSAPQAMELWGLVEGKDNVEKIREWRAERSRRREEARAKGEEVEEEPEVPKTLPREPLYVRIAEFTYDIHAPHNVQTFSIDPELSALEVDFGIVVLMMKSNWGRDYTCLYRLRVHGQPIGGQLASSSEEDQV